MAIQVFVSYARSDDQLPRGFEAEQGFVTFLHNQLQWEFSQLGNPRPKLWRDTQSIEGGADFEPLIEENLNNSDMLLVILSRNWMDSIWCRRELETFGRRWERLEGIERARQRIVFAAKQFIPITERHLLLQGKDGYNFFNMDSDAGHQQEEEFFKRGKPRDDRYWECVSSLAGYLWRQAQRLEHPASVAPIAAPPEARRHAVDDVGPALVADGGAEERKATAASRVVYLAKPAADMRSAYTRVAAELEGRGFAVVPDKAAAIPSDESAVEFIDQALAMADVSIHLLGEKAGYKPEDADHIVPLQLARAALRSEAAGAQARPLRRIIWAPRIPDAEEAAAVDATARDPLAVVQKFDRQLPNDKIDGDSLSKFVDFLVKHVDQATLHIEDFDSLDSDMRVYVYFRMEDFDYGHLIASRFYEREIEPVTPVFEGDQGELEAFHREYLRECDAVVLVWARAPDVWIRARTRELGSWRDLGRSEKFAVRGLIAAPPPGFQKKHVVTLPPRREIDITLDLTGYEEPPPEEIDRLIKAARPLDAR